MTEQNTNLPATQQPAGALTDNSLPEHLRGKVSRAGLEDMGKDDVQLPRLGLAQAMSPELEEGHQKFIHELKAGQIFNSLTKELYPRDVPILFTVLRRDKPRYVEFIPRAEGGGVKDPNVPANDPRTQFGPNGELPVATKFYDFLILTFPLRANPLENVLTLSFKSTGIKVAKRLNTLLMMRGTDCYAGMFQLSVTKEENAKGKFFNFTVDNVPAPNNWLPKEQYEFAERLFHQFKAADVKFDREVGADDGDASFDKDAIEAEAVKSGM